MTPELENAEILYANNEPYVFGRVKGRMVWSCHKCGHLRYVGESRHVNDYTITRNCTRELQQSSKLK